ncbi:MAG: phosphate ABC transporter, permease protein PstA [Desulfovibrionaceae bacterium CG1_02_65_16]|nr:MAG: phosphate ABC transporter, permease protein PstA [Desulfovibrionaceae bacterium CG1_02_65_16]
MTTPASSAIAPAPPLRRVSLTIAQGRDIRRNGMEWFVFMLLRAAILIVAAALVIIVGFLVKNGISVINWQFLTEAPRNNMTEGGVWPCIVGTLLLSLGSMAVALPLGVASAIYLHEYARPGTLMRVIRLGVNNLAGVPSVVFGLFGLGFFVTAMKLGVSLAAGWLTLGALCLPVVIGTAEEALRNVPATYREASLALGGTKWQTIWRVVLPSALPGILTGSILGIGRAAGETAAIMFTAAVFYTPKMPSSMFSDVMALPYHIYVLATAGTEIEKTRPLQYGTSLVLIALVLGMNLAAILLRAWLQKRHGH